jgi:hypothetical protein
LKQLAEAAKSYSLKGGEEAGRGLSPFPWWFLVMVRETTELCDV